MKTRGYTMLEVLITSTVMVLLVLAAYPTLNTASRRQEQVANMGMLETCVVQGIAAAKAPTRGETATIHITFTLTPNPIGCTITEVDTNGDRNVTASYQIANSHKYTLRPWPLVTNNEYIISVRPPYRFIVPLAGDQLLMMELRTNEAPITTNTTFFNLITGTIQTRSL